jgi:hypothetical protein
MTLRRPDQDPPKRQPTRTGVGPGVETGRKGEGLDMEMFVKPLAAWGRAHPDVLLDRDHGGDHRALLRLTGFS